MSSTNNNRTANNDGTANDGETDASLLRPLWEFAAPHKATQLSCIDPPAIGANNFEIKPALLNMVQQNQFGGLPTEDANLHLSVFLEYCNTLKLNGVHEDAIRLRLFPFSLRDRARAWFHSLPDKSIKSWEQMSQIFLEKFFPPSKTANLRAQLTNFRQKEGESLGEAWDRFTELIRKCPHHGLEKWLLVQTFYDHLTPNSRISVDNASAGGRFVRMNVRDGWALLETLAAHQGQYSERGNPRGAAGIYEVESLTMISAKLDALSKRFDQMNVSSVKQRGTCEICGDANHAVSDCPFSVPMTDEDNLE